jgi:hypothetical protein
MEEKFGWEPLSNERSEFAGNMKKTLYQRCYDILSNTIRNQRKTDQRAQLLKEHPEKRMRIKTNSLRQIIDYKDFKCHPQCSIARDQAIQGSDIDGALVILKNEVPEEKQIEFIAELRKQGFSVFHHSEVQKREQEVNEAKAKGVYSGQEFESLIRKSVEASNGEIRFYTINQLEEMKSQCLSNPVIIYVGGVSIQDESNNTNLIMDKEISETIM